jgi:hypothetical protein
MFLTRSKNQKITMAAACLIVLAIVMGWFFFSSPNTPVANLKKKSGVMVEADQVTTIESNKATEIDASRSVYGMDTGKNKIENTANASDIMGKGIVTGNINVIPAFDYKDLEKDNVLKELMETRKKKLGIKKSLDMIVKSNETFIIDGVKVSMQEILEKAFTEQGEIFQEKIANSGESIPEKIKDYGIYVVHPGDNIWNIHFNILKEYYSFNGSQVAPRADEPGIKGLSSGVGKILKFSETMVIIYNLIDKKIVTNINMLGPLSKLVIYNLDEVFSLLGEINYNNVDRIQFDGKNIWIPGKKS